MGMSLFENKRIIVTGAGSGIGFELVRQLFPDTKEILAVDFSEENLSSLHSKFPEIRGWIWVDLSEKAGNQGILDWVKAHWEGVDFCFANAGKAEYGPAELQNWREMEGMFQLNVFSPIQLGLELKGQFPHSRFRHTITCSAMALWAIPGYSLYGASKSALLQWARSVWAEQSGDWLTLAFPIATSTGFFQAAGKDIPKAFPVQTPSWVAKEILQATAKGKKKVFPSLLFRLMLHLNNFLYLIRPIYQSLEFRKYQVWLSKQRLN